MNSYEASQTDSGLGDLQVLSGAVLSSLNGGVSAGTADDPMSTFVEYDPKGGLTETSDFEGINHNIASPTGSEDVGEDENVVSVHDVSRELLSTPTALLHGNQLLGRHEFLKALRESG